MVRGRPVEAMDHWTGPPSACEDVTNDNEHLMHTDSPGLGNLPELFILGELENGERLLCWVWQFALVSRSSMLALLFR